MNLLKKTGKLDIVKSNGYALQYIDDSLKSDKQIVLAAVQECTYAIEYCSDSLLVDEEFICDAYKCNPDIISYIDAKTIKKYKRLQELYNYHKTREEEHDDLPF